MDALIEKLLQERRSLEKALDDLLAEYERHPKPTLARTIRMLREEIKQRERAMSS